MSVRIKSGFKDWTGAIRIIKARKKKMKKGSKKSIPSSNINKVAEELHPGFIQLKVVSIIKASLSSKTFRFISLDKKIPYFEAGQFMTIARKIGDSYVTRPYSISSAPFEVLGDNPFIEITVKRGNGDFFADYLLDETKEGDIFTSLIGLGQFNYDEIRDSKDIVAIAGGSGITPFYSMAKEIEHGTLDVNLTILYGSRKENDIVLKDKLDQIKSEKVRVIHILSDEEKDGYEHGFITEEILRKYSGKDSTYFICGPFPMISLVTEELKSMGVKQKRIRLDYTPQPKDIQDSADFPQDRRDKVFHMIVNRGISKEEFPCRSDESILVALERAGIKANNSCRAGYCGFCRTKLISGEVYIYKANDYRRAADKEFNYIHACSSYPLSDVEIRIPIKE